MGTFAIQRKRNQHITVGIGNPNIGYLENRNQHGDIRNSIQHTVDGRNPASTWIVETLEIGDVYHLSTGARFLPSITTPTLGTTPTWQPRGSPGSAPRFF